MGRTITLTLAPPTSCDCGEAKHFRLTLRRENGTFLVRNKLIAAESMDDARQYVSDVYGW